MKVCHVFPFFSIQVAGGTTDLMVKIARAQRDAGLEPIVLSGDFGFDRELAAQLEGVPVHVLRSYLDRAGFSISPGLHTWARRELPSVDVVHFHAYRTYQNVVIWKHCLREGIPYVVDAHGSVPLAVRKRRLKKLFDQWWGREMLMRAGSVIAETQVGVDEYLDLEPRIPKERLAILSPPFEVEAFEDLPDRGPFRAEFRIPEEAPLVSFLGRLHPIKGNDFLIKGFAEFSRTRPLARLVFIGPDGGHRAELEALAASLGVADKVIYAGFKSGKDKVQALVDSDVVAQMSRQEQGAWAPFEAVLSGTPIVVTGHTGAGEDVRRIDAGETVPIDDVPALAGALARIVDNRVAAVERTMRARQTIIDTLSFRTRVHEYTALYEMAARR